jgi:ubiquitin
MTTSTKKKPTVKSLAAELKQLRERQADTEARLAEKEGELAGFHQAEVKHSQELLALQEQVQQAKRALLPLFEKTKDWDGIWPPDQIAVHGRLLWGDLKAAADTGRAFAG